MIRMMLVPDSGLGLLATNWATIFNES